MIRVRLINHWGSNCNRGSGCMQWWAVLQRLGLGLGLGLALGLGLGTRLGLGLGLGSACDHIRNSILPISVVSVTHPFTIVL